MNKPLLIFALLLALVFSTRAQNTQTGTKFSQVTPITSFNSNSTFLVNTQDSSGRWKTRTVTADNLARGLGPWITNSGSGGGSGEANVLADAGTTNSARISQINGKSGVSLLVKTDQAGYGLVKTNQATNIVTAIDPAVVASQADLSGASNVLRSTAQTGSPMLTNIAGTGALTNKINSWLIWSSPASTNTYFAENRGLGLALMSNDFSGLLQRVVTALPDTAYLKISANPYYTNAYVFSNTVTITNMIIMEGDGNSATTFRAASTLNGPMIQLGTTSTAIGGITRINRLRFEGQNAGAGGVGVKVVNSAEPVFEYCEFFGFKFAGIQFSQENQNFWSFTDHCWFVLVTNTAHGILFDKTPVVSLNEAHHSITECIFGGNSVKEAICVSNYFPNLRIVGNHFRGVSSGAAVGAYAGGKFQIAGNQIVNWSGTGFLFYDRSSPTNYSASIIGNTRDNGDFVAIVGENVQGVFALGNTSLNGGGSEAVIFAGVGNGPSWNFDRDVLQVGHFPVTNRVVYVDGDGIFRPVTSAAPSSEYVRADGTTGTPAGAGEVNVNGEVSVTNATRIGLVYDKAGVTNRLRSVEAGYGLNTTNQGTNVVFAVGDAELIEWSGLSTNRVLTTNHAQLGFFSTNGVKVVAGTGGITVTAAASGSAPNLVHTFTISDDDAGGSGSTNPPVLARGWGYDTNAVSAGVTNLGTNATVTFDLMGPPVANYGIFGNSTINLTNLVAFTNHPGGRKVFLKVRQSGVSGTLTITPIGPHPIDWQGNLFIAQNATNTLLIEWDGTQFTGSRSHAETTGSGAYALSNAPSLFAPAINSATASRVAVFDGQSPPRLTNAAAVDLTELGYLDGVTSALQTQLNGKQNGQTNANQFGASTTLTIKKSALATNLVNLFEPVVVTGTGGANTNFTLQAIEPEVSINGFTNVSIRAVMQTDPSFAAYLNVTITNLSGSDRTLEFSAVTNRWRFSGVYGTNAPSTITNNTALLLSLRCLGTNTLVGYSYFTAP